MADLPTTIPPSTLCGDARRRTCSVTSYASGMGSEELRHTTRSGPVRGPSVSKGAGPCFHNGAPVDTRGGATAIAPLIDRVAVSQCNVRLPSVSIKVEPCGAAYYRGIVRRSDHRAFAP